MSPIENFDFPYVRTEFDSNIHDATRSIVPGMIVCTKQATSHPVLPDKSDGSWRDEDRKGSAFQHCADSFVTQLTAIALACVNEGPSGARIDATCRYVLLRHGLQLCAPTMRHRTHFYAVIIEPRGATTRGGRALNASLIESPAASASEVSTFRVALSLSLSLRRYVAGTNISQRRKSIGTKSERNASRNLFAITISFFTREACIIARRGSPAFA
jgi:hypothetical protein